MLLEALTLNCLNLKQCLAHESIKNNLKFNGGAIFRIAKSKCQITGREDSFYENFISNNKKLLFFFKLRAQYFKKVAVSEGIFIIEMVEYKMYY